jgi:hypothetical protein
MTEFVPLLVLAAAVGLVDVWRRVDGRSRRVRGSTVTAVAVVGAFCLAANLAASSAPTDAIAWDGDRARSYVELQQSISDVTGHPLDENVVRGERLPERAPADRLFVVGDCAGLYLSTGDKDGPWVPIELPETDLNVIFHERVSERGRVPLVTVGGEASSTVSIETGRSGRIRFRADENYGYPNLYFPSASKWMPLQVGRTYRVGVATDAGLHRFSVTVDGHRVIDRRPLPDGPLVVHARADAADGASPALTVVEKSGPEPTLCRSLIATK